MKYILLALISALVFSTPAKSENFNFGKEARIITDPETGCQYIGFYKGMTLRIGSGPNKICGREEAFALKQQSLLMRELIKEIRLLRQTIKENNENPIEPFSVLKNQ